MTAMISPTTCLANQKIDDAQLQAWTEQFNRDGYLFIESVLPPDLIEELKADLDAALTGPRAYRDGSMELVFRVFESSPANVKLFELDPIAAFAERAIAADCHVIHNNNLRTPPGQGISGWHQDDSPHLIVTHGEPPTNIRMPCLLATANYYLTDVETLAHGPTQVVPGSHLFGGPPPNGGFAGPEATRALIGTKYESMIKSCLGPAGSVVIFNNQLWHRGSINTSDRTRYVAQVSYARRIIGHKYSPFMNYQMPEHVYKNAGPRLKRLLGFLPNGAYG